jgi:hypothetical protein
MLGCSVDPMPLLPAADTEASSTQGPTSLDTDTQLSTIGQDTGETGETQSAIEDTVDTLEDTVDTLEDGDCSWQCVPLTGPSACNQADVEDSFHNANFTCGNEGYICCQPPNAKGGIKQPCNQQPAMSCQTSCGQGLIQNNKFFCNNAKWVCCEDPAGPAPTCAQLGGTCIPPLFYECDDDETEVDLACDGFGQSCCLRPACPWGCVTFSGENTCSKGKNPPVGVRNYDYSCSRKDEVCCQPTKSVDTDPSDTDTGVLPLESCNKQGSLFSCEAVCGKYEQQRVDFYCPSAGVRCCEDIRKDCESGLGGTCDNDWLGNCADNTEANPGGRCPSGVFGGESTCCTKLSPYNNCAKEGGVCVDISDLSSPTDILTACPFGYTPEMSTLCGDFRLCCKSIFGG